jgi:hypothetical protein
VGHRGLVVRLLDACLGSAHACSVGSSDPLGVLDSRLGGSEPLRCLLHQISSASAAPASGTVKLATPQPKVGPDSAHVPLGLVGRTDLNARFRKAVRHRGHFPNEQAALKVLYLVATERKKNRANPTGRINAWKPTLNALTIHYGDRIQAAN